MKFNDEYIVCAVVLAVLVFVIVYSLNTREHLTQMMGGGVPPTCPVGTVLSTLPENLGKCTPGQTSGIVVSAAVCPTDTVFNSNYNLCMPVTPGFGTLNEPQLSRTIPPTCATNYKYDSGLMKCVALNDTVRPTTQEPKCPTGSTFNTTKRTCVFSQAPPSPTTPITPDVIAAQVEADIKSKENNTWGGSRLNDDVDGGNVLPPYGPTSSIATAAIAALTGPGDAYVRKSSLVPCTCTKHSMGCERHAGSNDSSIVPGDKDGAFADGNSDQMTAQDQRRLKRPFSKAFEEQGEPTGFLNSFAAFG